MFLKAVEMVNAIKAIHQLQLVLVMYCFHRCVSVNGGRGGAEGTPLSLISGPFPGLWPNVLSGSVGVPRSYLGEGYPNLEQGVPPVKTGGTPPPTAQNQDGYTKRAVCLPLAFTQ